jgi:drug/metabolite transporter (DMT)-like permease
MRDKTAGWGSGLVGVMIFSGSLPATRIAVDAFAPLFVTGGRAVVAALLGAALLVSIRPPRPLRSDLLPLAIVALGVVVGFPLLTAFAVMHMSVARSVVFVGLLPLATAIFGVVRAGERPRPAFWLFAAAGAAAVAIFALAQGGQGSWLGDTLMVAAILLCGMGYAEGASLSRRLGGWQVISWALLLASPAMTFAALMALPPDWSAIAWQAWAGFAYVSLFSMLLGFVFWYRGLALGGVAAVGQLQLLQPFMGLFLAAMLLGEPLAWPMIASTAVVILCVAGARRFA